MKKLVLMLLVSLIFLFSSTLPIYVHGQSQPRTWVVDSHGGTDFTTIQSAINAADSGDTIFVKSGTYDTPSQISKSLILYGENSKTTILSGQLTISTNNFTLSGFSVPFIWVQYCNGAIINNVNTEIRVINSSENVFENSALNGIGFDWSHQNIVYNNTISGNSLRGIGASFDCASNIIANNTITGNQNGILASISGSKFFHNVISANSVQANIQDNLANTWDDGYPSGGNYWGNYQGTDLNHDGIGDTPYVIDSKNIDNYPFMSPSLIPSTVLPTALIPTPSFAPTPTPILSSPSPIASHPITSPSLSPPTSTAQIASPSPTKSRTDATGLWNPTTGLLLGVLAGCLLIVILIILFLKRKKNGKPQIVMPIYKKCFDCGRELLPNVEQVEVIKNNSNTYQKQVYVCKDCMLKEFNKQDGLCPQCKEPLKWNGNIREFLGEWYHPKCVFELQQGKNTKEVREITRQVVVKFRCPYCKYTYDENLDKCPQCGGKRS